MKLDASSLFSFHFLVVGGAFAFDLFLVPPICFAVKGKAQKAAGTEPDHCVFPACENGKIDPATPQKRWRSAWRSLRKAAGLKDLRFHDLSHHAITELAES
jgi:hypothetical protein